MKTFHYGWVIVAVGIVVTCVGMGATFSLGVFLQPIAQDMGWSRAGVSAAATLNFLAMGVATFAWGALSDRVGVRVVVLAGGALLGIGLAAASQAPDLLSFQLLYGIVVGIAAGSSFVPLTALTARWFSQNRSLAVALVSAGLGLGTTTVAPLARWMITAHDWRFAMLALAVLAWAVILPLALLIRPPPQPTETAAQATQRQAAEQAGMTVGQAIRTPAFVAIALTYFACCLTHAGPIFHMVSYVIDCGISPMAAVTVISVAGLASLAGKVVCGLIADRAGAKPTLVAGLVVQAVVVSLYPFARNLAGFYALGMVFGLAYGGVMPLYAILVREFFPARIMGTLFGICAMVSTMGMAVGPVAGGFLFDAFGSYAWMYLGSFGVGLGAVAIALTVRPPVPVGGALVSATT
jgi:MFS family permease